MKNLFKLLSILAISTPIPLTVVACGDKPTPTNKIDLKSKITSLTTDITANVNKNNNELDTQIKSANEIKSLNPNLTNPTIKYFSDSQGKTNVSNQKQKSGDLYVVITAKKDSKSYQGSTPPIKINLKNQDTRIDLKTITQLNGLEITANINNSYKELITDINNFNEFKSKPLTDGYQLQFYDENNKEITNDKQELEKISKISVKIISSLNDKSYQGSTIIDITKQTNISDIDMQNYFKNKTLPLAAFTPENPSTPSTVNKQEAVENVISSLKKIQKKYETATKLILEGMYKEKIDFNKLKNKNEIYDINKNPVHDNWFENKEEKKEAKIIIYYGSVKEEDGYFFPIWINIT